MTASKTTNAKNKKLNAPHDLDPCGDDACSGPTAWDAAGGDLPCFDCWRVGRRRAQARERHITLGETADTGTRTRTVVGDRRRDDEQGGSA